MQEAAKETSKTNTKEQQKADIERRRQEELISKVKNILNKLGLEYLLPKSVTNIFNLDKSRTKGKAGMTAQWDSLRDAILLNEDFSLENLIHELIHSYIQREVQEDSYENSKKLSNKGRRLAEKIKELNDKGNFNADVNFLISYVLQGQENITITNYEEFATYYLTNKTVREALEKNGFGNIVKSFVKELTGLSDNQISNIIKLDLTAIESNKEINAKYDAESAALEEKANLDKNQKLKQRLRQKKIQSQ